MSCRFYLCVALGLTAALPARAATNPTCDSLTNPIYITGSSAIEPFLIGLAVPLQNASTPYTIVYKNKGSCTGVDAIVNGTKITGTATYYDATGVAATCDLPTGGQAADIGVSDVFPKTCMGEDAPSTVGDFWGPNQAMLLVVPKASIARGITWQQIHMLFGYGQAAEVSPWLDNNTIFHRNDQSGTQQMVSYATDLPASVWLGTNNPGSGDGPYDAGGSNGVRDGVAAADATGIGILGADVYDTARDSLSALAVKGKGQLYAYYPDSTPTSFDKKNVRDGHYLIWGPEHMLAQVDSSGAPVNPDAKFLIDVIQGKQSVSGADVVQIAIQSHVIPDCAMTVQRQSEEGPLSPYKPAKPCACYFDANVENGSTTCATCSDPDGTPCASGGVCRRGYCEAN